MKRKYLNNLIEGSPKGYINLINSNVLMKKDGQYTLEKHNILINNGIIEAFDINNEFIQSIDMEKFILFSPFYNIHCHLGESIFRDISGEDWTLERYLKYTGDFNRGLSNIERDILWKESADYTIRKIKEEGTVGICAARSAEICEKYKLDNMSGYPIMNSNKLIHFKRKGSEGFKEYLKRYDNETCNVGIFFHSLYKNDEESLSLAFECLENGGEYISIHISEDYNTKKKEVDVYGKEAIYVLDEYGLLTPNTILIHCGYTTEYELELIAKRGASIIICPISNHFLNSRVPNMKRIEELGINWCIATDGLATGRTFSLIRQANELKRMYSFLSYETLFEHFTERPAQLYNRTHYTGRIEVGVRANFLITKSSVDNITDFFKKLFLQELDWKLWSCDE